MSQDPEPGSELHVLSVLHSLSVTQILGGQYYHPHFTSKAMTLRREEHVPQGHIAFKWRSQDLIPGLSDSQTLDLDPIL